MRILQTILGTVQHFNQDCADSESQQSDFVRTETTRKPQPNPAMKNDTIKQQIKRIQELAKEGGDVLTMLEEMNRNGANFVSPYVSINIDNALKAMIEARKYLAL